ncbi:hypothetical protein INR49_006561 [Caranx melampygus]|nr:hypothetical protein INR49_006561 [Caranx melampygus]
MNTLQVLCAARTNPGYLGYRLYHAPGASSHYSTAAAAAAAPDGSRSFCLSRDRLTMQELNMRLASYLQQEELSRKSPTVLKELDKYLGTVSLLQDQINECLSAQAEMKLDLLSAELTMSHFSTRCERESEHCARLEAELNDLRLLGEELMVHKLPELQKVLNDETEELMELEMQYQQGREALLAQVSGDTAVEVQSVEPSHLIQQMDAMRHSNAIMLNQEQDELWCYTQVPVLSSPEETFDPAEEELMELREAAAELGEELRQLQEENIMLEDSGEELTESFVMQLVALQQRADDLCRDLDSAQQTATQQAYDYHTLLDIKNHLETEIHDYKMLLDGLNRERVSSVHLYSSPAFLSSCTPAYPAASEIFMPDREVSVWGGNHQVADTWTIRQTPAVTPVFETVTTNQSGSALTTVTTNQSDSALTINKTAAVTSVFEKVAMNQSDSALTVNKTPAVTSVFETVTTNQSDSALTINKTAAVTSVFEKVAMNQSDSALTVNKTPAVTSVFETVTTNQSDSALTINKTAAVTSVFEKVAVNQSDSALTVRETPAVTSVFEKVAVNQSGSALTVRETPAVTSVFETVTTNQSDSALTINKTAAVTSVFEKVAVNQSGSALTVRETPAVTSVFEKVSSTKTDASLTPDIDLSSAETEVLMTMTDKELRPVITEEHIKIKSKGPVAEGNVKESCPTEKTGNVRSVETCTLETKEEGQSVSFNGEQVVTGESSNSGVTVTAITGEGLSGGVSPRGHCGSKAQKKTVRIGSTVTIESGVVEGSSGGSGGRISKPTGSYKISSSGSGEWKPVYSSASGRRSTSQRAQSPRRINSGGSGGWLNTSVAGGNRISSAGSGSKLSIPGANDQISSRTGGRAKSSGGRVISSSDGPVRSTGSGTGSKKERISVCKMAALSISAAGRERSQDRQRQHHQQQHAAATSPLIQRWLTTSVPVSVQ